MLSAESTIRQQINRDEDCAEASMQLMAMRVVMLGLIGQRNRLAARAPARCRRAVSWIAAPSAREALKGPRGRRVR